MKQERTLKQVLITLDNVTRQCENIGNFFEVLTKETPEYDTYFKLFDYVWSSLYDIEEKIKTL